MLDVYFGHEDRVPVGSTVFMQSLLEHSKSPVSITALSRINLPGVREGSNAFTYRRFLIPYLRKWQGWALFVDGSDMLCRCDISDILTYRPYSLPVAVVKHDYQTRHPRKYVGSGMESDNLDYPRKQWASVMLINCAHYAWRRITPEYVAKADPMELLQLRFLSDDYIGDLPKEWNWLADEHGVNPAANLVHFTAGVPAMPGHRDAPMADEWLCARDRAVSSI